jgi:hypothetical protein
MASQFFRTETTLDADGNSDVHTHEGGRVTVSLQGDFGGGTATLQASVDGTNYGTATDIITGNTVVVAAGTTNAAYAGGIEIGPCLLRVNLASSTDPDLFVQIAHTGGDRVTG